MTGPNAYELGQRHKHDQIVQYLLGRYRKAKAFQKHDGAKELEEAIIHIRKMKDTPLDGFRDSSESANAASYQLTEKQKVAALRKYNQHNT